MRVRDGVRRPGVSIQAGQKVHDAAVSMERDGVGSLVVMDGDDLVGIVTDRDLVRRAMAKGLESDARIDGVMSSPVATVKADDDIEAAYSLFRAHAIRRLVVMHEGAFVGVLTIDDLLMNITSQLADLARPVTAETLFGQHDASMPATS